MARKPRDYAAEYARRKARAQAQGYSGYRAKRAATSTAASSTNKVLQVRQGGARFMTIDDDTDAREWAIAKRAQRRYGWPHVDALLYDGGWRAVGPVDLRPFPTAGDFLGAIAQWAQAHKYRSNNDPDDEEESEPDWVELATLDWGKRGVRQGSALRKWEQ